MIDIAVEKELILRKNKYAVIQMWIKILWVAYLQCDLIKL